MIVRPFSMMTIAMCLSLSAHAAPSINDISGCQATLAFIAEKADSVEAKYGATDVETVSAALSTYGAFLQAAHMAPGLSALNGGDVAKTDAMQAQVSQYQDTLKEALAKKYSQPRLFSDHAVMINNCYAIAPMDEGQTAMMKTALATLIEMAKQE